MKPLTITTAVFLSMVFPKMVFGDDAKSSDAVVLLNETFSGDKVPSAWQPGGRKGAFVIVDGALQGTAAPDDSHGPSIGVPIKGRDLQVEFDLKLSKPGYFLFLVDGDSQFKGQAHLLRFAATPAQVQLMQDRGDPESKKAQKIERDKRGGKRIPPTKQQLADPSFYRIDRLAKHAATPASGKWHHVHIALRGNDVTARFAEKQTNSQSVSGQSPAMRLVAKGSVLDVSKSRLVFLVGQSGTVLIDNVVVKDLEREQ